MSGYAGNAKFEADYNALMGKGGDLDQFITAQQQYESSITDYNTEMAELKTTQNPEVAFMVLSMIMANQGFNELNEETAVDGGSLQIQGDLTKLGNDIEDMTNQTDDATVVGKDASGNPIYQYNQKYPNNYLHYVASDSEALAELLTNTSDPRGSVLINQALGTQASSALASQYTIIRDQIYDPSVGGTIPASNTYYFDATTQNTDPSGDKYIESYCEFQNDLKMQGDPKQANEAEKAKTDAFNENTSTTQSTNAASQEEITNVTNLAKSFQSFVVSMLHAISNVGSAAVKAATRS